MGFKIEDGRGRGNVAGVTDKNRLRTFGATEPQASESAEFGNTFFFPTNFVSHTTAATEYAVCAIQNSAADAFKVESLRVSTNAPTFFRVYKNPTSTTNLVSAASQNSNLAVNKPFRGTFRVGGSGATQTGGVLLGQVYVVNGPSELRIDGSILLGPSDQLVLTADVSATALTQYGSTIVGFYPEEVG